MGALFIIALIAIGVRAGILYFKEKNSPQEQVKKELERLEAAYANDTYGGDTPEETLRLFIAALKKGDTELAAKYFFIADRDKNYKYLESIKTKGNLMKMIEDAQRLKLTKQDQDYAFFTIANEQKIVEVQVVLRRGPNGKWKIIEL